MKPLTYQTTCGDEGMTDLETVNLVASSQAPALLLRGRTDPYLVPLGLPHLAAAQR